MCEYNGKHMCTISVFTDRHACVCVFPHVNEQCVAERTMAERTVRMFTPHTCVLVYWCMYAKQRLECAGYCFEIIMYAALPCV